MSLPFHVSRRNLVTFAASAAAVSAVPSAARAASASSATTLATPAQLLAVNRERMLREFVRVRQAPNAASREQAFAALAAAIKLHLITASHVAVEDRGMKAGTLTSLYDGRQPEAVLAQVIVRELEASPVTESTWMTRFAELEAVIYTQAA